MPESLVFVDSDTTYYRQGKLKDLSNASSSAQIHVEIPLEFLQRDILLIIVLETFIKPHSEE